MNYLIGGEANDAIKSAINNALLSKKNPSTQKSSIKIPSNLIVKDNSNNAAEEISAKASINNSDRVIDNLNTSIKSSTNTKSEATDTVSNGAFVASGGAVQVEILNSDSGYDNKVYWSTDDFQTKNYVGIDNQTSSFNIGDFAAGTQIKFGIDNGEDGLYKTGSASDNSDYFQHAKFTSTASGIEIGFEDLNGGGDKDFNDAIIKVNNLDNSQSKSNPGQSSGKSNSPNEELNNPNQAVVKGADLKAQAHNKAINNSQINKTLIKNLQALPTQFEQNNFKELNNTKKIQDNFSKEAVINPLAQSYYSDTNKIFTQAVWAQSNKIQPVVGNQNINLAEGQVKVQSNLNNNQYLNISLNNRANSILDKKPIASPEKFSSWPE